MTWSREEPSFGLLRVVFATDGIAMPITRMRRHEQACRCRAELGWRSPVGTLQNGIASVSFCEMSSVRVTAARSVANCGRDPRVVSDRRGSTRVQGNLMRTRRSPVSVGSSGLVAERCVWRRGPPGLGGVGNGVEESGRKAVGKMGIGEGRS